MQTVVPIKGNVQHVITMDPGIWIFDDRRIDLDIFFTGGHIEKDEMEEYKRSMGKHWSREIMEGATFPPTLETEKQFEEKKVITGTYGIYLNHFLKNAEPKKNATQLFFETTSGEKHVIPITNVDNVIMKYCEDGKPLGEEGPIHILFKDGSNEHNPIKNVVAIHVE
ncbi:peptidyl-prolyl cis-trans isomerase [Sporosarcina sp. CAU 1771]